MSWRSNASESCNSLQLSSSFDRALTGAQKYKLLCFAAGRLIKKYGGMFNLQNKTKIKRFWMVRQKENDTRRFLLI